jgi:alpha-L-fucosidase
MFIHWGPVALEGTEIGWSRDREIPAAEYDRLYQRFDPVEFDADEWVRIARQSGMRYVILVTKHHDGFTLWDSAATDYDIAASPFGRDIVGEISAACKKAGLLFGTYYSILDWYHPDYPIKFTGGVQKSGATMERYLPFLRTQLDELVNRYGTQILWFDGEWEDPWTHKMGMDLYAWLRGLKPDLLINNRIDKGRRGMEGKSLGAQFAGDFETPEQQVGAFNTETPWEACITLGEQWAWKPNDKLKSAEDCIRILLQTVGGDGNLLLNVGPTPDGTIEARQVQILLEIGSWLERFGDTVYRTRGGPIPPAEWGVTTQRGNTVFVHILHREGAILTLDGLPRRPVSARLFGGGDSIPLESDGGKSTLHLPALVPDTVDTVVEITLEALDPGAGAR